MWVFIRMMSLDIVVSGTGLETGTVLERQEVYNMSQETAT